MANSSLFKSNRVEISKTNTTNEAGGRAYLMSDKHALAQLAVTNCFNDVYYLSGEQLLENAKNLALKLKDDPKFIAQLCLYSRHNGYLKDMPAFLMCILAQTDTNLFRKIFNEVIDNGKMLRNFCQIARSGAAGRKFNLSAGACRKAIQSWFNNRKPEYILNDSIGNDPSLRDILRMSRVKVKSEQMSAALCWASDGKIDDNEKNIATYRVSDGVRRVSYIHEFDSLPQNIKEYELFRRGKGRVVPRCDFRLLDNLNLSQEEWASIAINANWHATRMNLNQFARKGAFNFPACVDAVVSKLTDKKLIQKAKVYPYQLFTSYIATQTNDAIPAKVKAALLTAADIATENVPKLKGKTIVLVDVSQSMSHPITGNREGSTSVARCIDAAAVFASIMLRNNPDATIIPFDTRVHKCDLIPQDSFVTNAQRLAKYGGGGTNCSIGFQYIVENNLKVDNVIIISDNESWRQTFVPRKGSATDVMIQWQKIKNTNKNAKLVCVDIQPYLTHQVSEHKDILTVGGWSDAVFEICSAFFEDNLSKDRFLEEIEKIQI